MITVTCIIGKTRIRENDWELSRRGRPKKAKKKNIIQPLTEVRFSSMCVCVCVDFDVRERRNRSMECFQFLFFLSSNSFYSIQWRLNDFTHTGRLWNVTATTKTRIEFFFFFASVCVCALVFHSLLLSSWLFFFLFISKSQLRVFEAVAFNYTTLNRFNPLFFILPFWLWRKYNRIYPCTLIETFNKIERIIPVDIEAKESKRKEWTRKKGETNRKEVSRGWFSSVDDVVAGIERWRRRRGQGRELFSIVLRLWVRERISSPVL